MPGVQLVSTKHEYLKDGVWYGKRPPDRFIGLVRDGNKEWEKTEVRELVPGIGNRAGHECCDCPHCAAWHANACTRPRSEGRLFPGGAA
jgi:hypothetical protein